MPLVLPLWPRITFDILGLLCFQMNFRSVFSRSVRHVNRISIGIALYLYNSFGSVAIFTILVLPSQDQGKEYPSIF